MKGSAMRYVWASAFVLLLCHAPSGAAEPSGSLERAFMETVQTAKAAGRHRYLDELALSPYEKAGEQLASRFPDADTGFLEAQATNTADPSAMRLAWLMLAKLSDRKDARDVVLKRAVAGEDDMAVLSISFAPAGVRRELAESVLVQAKPRRVKEAMVELLGYIGDDNSVRVLNEEQARWGGASRDLRQAATQAAACIQERLKQPAAEQEAWLQCGLRFWQTLREVAIPRLVEARYDWAADVLAGSGVKCPPSFLRCHIRGGDLLAITIAGRQKETTLVDALGAAAEPPDGFPRRAAMVSLACIDSKEAMDMLLKQIKPGGVKENERIAERMGNWGGRASAELLEQLGRDERYKESWPAFQKASKWINQRLEHMKKQSEAQPQPDERPRPAAGD